MSELLIAEKSSSLHVSCWYYLASEAFAAHSSATDSEVCNMTLMQMYQLHECDLCWLSDCLVLFVDSNVFKISLHLIHLYQHTWQHKVMRQDCVRVCLCLHSCWSDCTNGAFVLACGSPAVNRGQIGAELLMETCMVRMLLRLNADTFTILV